MTFINWRLASGRLIAIDNARNCVRLFFHIDPRVKRKRFPC